MNLVFARLHLEVEKSEVLPVRGAADLVKRHGLHTQPQECFWAIANDAAGNVRTIMEVARGNHDTVELDIPSLFTVILATAAPAFSVAHNHPTMSVLPSAADIDLTHRVMDAANVLGLLFEDHVIVEPSGERFSFREAGLIGGLDRRQAVGPRGKRSGKASEQLGRMQLCRIHDRCDRTFRDGSLGAVSHVPRLNQKPLTAPTGARADKVR
jgi:hypothetical protein